MSWTLIAFFTASSYAAGTISYYGFQRSKHYTPGHEDYLYAKVQGWIMLIVSWIFGLIAAIESSQ